ncbi:MAG: HAMP domain-containing sensor histidine kinase [Candidatus Obscuribacterales bacterium]
MDPADPDLVLASMMDPADPARDLASTMDRADPDLALASTMDPADPDLALASTMDPADLTCTWLYDGLGDLTSHGFHDGPGGPGLSFMASTMDPADLTWALSNVQQSGMDANFHNGSPGNSDLHRFVHEFHPPPFMHAQGRFIVHTENPDTFFIGTKIMLFDTERMHPEPSYVLASTSNIWQSTLLFDFKFLLLVGGLILLLSLLFWWPFVHQIARSIGELTAVTEKIADGKFDARIVRARQDEIGRLGDAVNTMAAKLNEYVLTQKRFLADVSHELFSPLARLHMAIELLEDCKPEDSPRHFKEINEEIDEMKSLITELLAYSKAGLIQSERQLATIDLKPIFEDLVAKFNDQMEIKVELDPSSKVEGDETLLSRSFSNIIRNSIRYAGEAGPLTIQSKHDGPDLFVSFSDCGPGVPEETLKYLGQPFFRPEFSRNRNLGGFGLGLAIVKSCIEACNGSVTLSNLPAGGLNVQIRLKSVH